MKNLTKIQKKDLGYIDNMTLTKLPATNYNKIAKGKTKLYIKKERPVVNIIKGKDGKYYKVSNKTVKKLYPK